MNGQDLALRVGVTYRQIDHWTTNGYLVAKVANPGSGNPRDYSPREVRVAEVMAWLVSDGMTPKVAARVARTIARRGKARLGRHLVVMRRTDAHA